MSAEKKPAFADAAEAVAQALDADVLFINSPIYRPLDRQVMTFVRKRRRRKNVMLILVTEGGDADAAFRVARSLQENYEKFWVYVTGWCKSAGTLVALGAHELIIGDAGELGPLDVQMTKTDELLQRQSGLTATAALSTLHDQAFQAFEHFMLQTVSRSGESISTKTATSIAVQLTCGLFSHVYGHVDPMHVGEAGRALRVAEKYGQLLQKESGNFSTETLTVLTNGYPSHGFVIDRTEAEDLFNNVREPSTSEQALADVLKSAALMPGDDHLVAYLSSELPLPQDQVLPGIVPTDQSEQTHENVNSSTVTTPGEDGTGESAPSSGDHRATIRKISAIATGGQR